VVLTSNVNLLGPQSEAHTGVCVCVCVCVRMMSLRVSGERPRPEAFFRTSPSAPSSSGPGLVLAPRGLDSVSFTAWNTHRLVISYVISYFGPSDESFHEHTLLLLNTLGFVLQPAECVLHICKYDLMTRWPSCIVGEKNTYIFLWVCRCSRSVILDLRCGGSRKRVLTGWIMQLSCLIALDSSVCVCVCLCLLQRACRWRRCCRHVVYQRSAARGTTSPQMCFYFILFKVSTMQRSRQGRMSVCVC